MTLVADERVLEFIRARGGRLHLVVRTGRCCGGGPRLLTAATTPPADAGRYRAVAGAGIELRVSPRLAPLPDELRLRLRGRHRPRIDILWDGAACLLP